MMRLFCCKTEKELALIECMENRYQNFKGASWYDNLNNAINAYYGYWRFEATALANIYKLNIKPLSNN